MLICMFLFVLYCLRAHMRCFLLLRIPARSLPRDPTSYTADRKVQSVKPPFSSSSANLRFETATARAHRDLPVCSIVPQSKVSSRVPGERKVYQKITNVPTERKLFYVI